MEINVHSHRSGGTVVQKEIDEIKLLFKDINPIIGKNTVSSIKDEIRNKLVTNGWSGENRLDSFSKITITSSKGSVGLCLQTGNVGRVYADLLKLQTLFLKGFIKAGIILLPEQNTAKKLGSNIANDDRLIRELPIFSQVITIPLAIVGFKGDINYGV